VTQVDGARRGHDGTLTAGRPPQAPPRAVTVALAGNPNCGKTTLFNALTGSRQRVGNWPGVTVERLEGSFRRGGRQVRVVDLPGIYSFAADSIDETIARRYILEERPDVVVNIVDATNLQRHLYLTTQLLEMRVPVVVALNMMDQAARRKMRIEVEHLSRHLDCPVVPLIASRGEGVEALKDTIAAVADSRAVPRVTVRYDAELEKAIEAVERAVAARAAEAGIDARRLAVKLLEGDSLARGLAEPAARDLAAAEARRVAKHVGQDIDVAIADGRYAFLHGLARDVVRRDELFRRTVSDAVDRVVLNRVLGVPIFLGVMYLLFVLTISLAHPFIDFLDLLCEAVFVRGGRALLAAAGAGELVTTLLADGVGGGIQVVATLVAPIFFIFLWLAVLEDSGYMARAAFVMDRLLQRIGLPGKAFLPLLVGFGCSVPAILATRTLEDRRDRLATVVMAPFMSCGARLPIYTLFAVTFFPRRGGLVIFALYAVGALVALGTGRLLRRTLLAGETSSFVMELSPYHAPTLGGVLYHAWGRLRAFILRAGKIIVAFVVILRLLSAVGTDGGVGRVGAHDSLLATMGRAITPAFGPMGIDSRNWPATVGLFTGLFAKEAVVGTLDALYSHEPAGASAQAAAPGGGEGAPGVWAGVRDAFGALRRGMRDFAGSLGNPLGLGGAGEETALTGSVRGSTFVALGRNFPGRPAALAYMLFVLLYCPCVGAVAAIWREAGPRWAAFAVAYSTVLAWLVATAFHQAATAAEHPLTSALWLGLTAAALAGIAGALKLVSRGTGGRAEGLN